MDPMDPDLDPDPQHCFKQSPGARKEPSINRVVVAPACQATERWRNWFLAIDSWDSLKV